MTQNDKELLLKDICARLPYGVKVKFYSMEYPYGSEPITLTVHLLKDRWKNIHDVKPYLRPMSSMTEKEKEEYINIFTVMWDAVDWLDAHYFDYHIVPSTGKTMIESNLALEAPEGMYKTE